MKPALIAALALIALPAMAEVKITDAYARVASPMAKAGAAYMLIENTGAAPDRLIAVESPAAKRVELHTHIDDNGVMRMREVEAGFEIPPGGSHALKRGGDHVMFMGLTERWAHGDTVPVTLVFEGAGAVSVEIPVDLEREPAAHSH